MENINLLTEEILRCAFKVHSALGPGLLESSYKECLFYELMKSDLIVEKEKALPRYQNVPFGVGRRSCMGRFLVQLMVRAIITQLCRRFDVQKPQDITEYYRYSQIFTTVENPIVLIKERRLD